LATPIVAGMLALVASKYPDATGNQLLHSLIANTGSEEHEVRHDSVYGYGIPNLTRMLAVDPTGYPDVNPLASDTPAWDGDLTLADIAPTAPSTSSPAPGTPTSNTASDRGDDGSALSVPVWVWIGVGTAALTALVVAIMVVTSRRRHQV